MQEQCQEERPQKKAKGMDVEYNLDDSNHDQLEDDGSVDDDNGSYIYSDDGGEDDGFDDDDDDEYEYEDDEEEYDMEEDEDSVKNLSDAGRRIPNRHGANNISYAGKGGMMRQISGEFSCVSFLFR